MVVTGIFLFHPHDPPTAVYIEGDIDNILVAQNGLCPHWVTVVTSVVKYSITGVVKSERQASAEICSSQKSSHGSLARRVGVMLLETGMHQC